eukprot:1651195-Rhodomonas_salina.2
MLVSLSDYSMTTDNRQNQVREQKPTQQPQDSEPLRSTPTIKEKRPTKGAMDSSRHRNRTRTATNHNTNQGVKNKKNSGNGEE